MPTKFKSGKRKFKRKYLGKKSYKYMALRKKMKKIAKTVVNGNREKKEYDWNFSGTLTTSGTFTSVLQIPTRGSGFYQHSTDEMYLRKINLRYQISTTSSHYQAVRILLIAVRSGVPDPSTLSNIFSAEDYTSGGPVVPAMNDLIDTRYFIPIYDKFVTVNASNAASVNGGTVAANKVHMTTLDTVKLYKKIKYVRGSNVPVNFRLFWVVFYGGDTLSAAPVINGIMRVQFMDVE